MDVRVRRLRIAVRAEQAELYAAAGDYERAFHEYKRYHAAGEELRSAQQDARTHTRQVMFETTQARNDAERYREQALHDQLTGLRNRRYADEHLPVELALAADTRTPLTVAFIDIDHFKRVNDTHGHGIGDEVLRHVAMVFKDNIRSVDSLGRYGGEEFLLVMPETDVDGGMATAENLRRILGRTAVTIEQPTSDLVIPIAMSAGASMGSMMRR